MWKNFRTVTFRVSAQSSSTSIPCASRRASCGEIRRVRAIPCAWPCGKAILNPPDPILHSPPLKDLPRLPLDEGGPVFAEPWKATAFALAVRLSTEGHFTWKEWAAALADELKAAAEHGEPDD